MQCTASQPHSRPRSPIAVLAGAAIPVPAGALASVSWTQDLHQPRSESLAVNGPSSASSPRTRDRSRTTPGEPPATIVLRCRLRPGRTRQSAVVLVHGDQRSQAGSFQPRFQSAQAAIYSRFHSAHGRAGHLGDFFDRHLFMETKHQSFAVFRRQMLHGCGNLLALLALNRYIEPRGLPDGRNIERDTIVVSQTAEFSRLPAAQVVEEQIVRDGEKPCTEFMTAVVLVAALKHPDPGFLKEVLSNFPAPGQVYEVTQKTVLVLLDQVIEKVGIMTPKSTSDLYVLVRHRTHEIASSHIHAAMYTRKGQEKMHVLDERPHFSQNRRRVSSVQHLRMASSSH